MKREEWRPVVGYEGLYEVSNKGNVKRTEHDTFDTWYGGRTRHLKERLLHIIVTITNGQKRCNVGLLKDGIRENLKVHRLVAKAFIPIPDHLKHIPIDDLDVNHLDENPLNNCVENLEWCTHYYNCNYGTRNERVSKSKIEKGLGKTVLQYTLNGEFLKRHISAAAAARTLPEEIFRHNKYPRHAICSVCRGEQKTAYGFVWKYE